MFIWKIYPQTEKILSPEWEAIIASSLGEEIHLDRKIGYVSAREALRLALSDYKILTSPSEIELVRFDSLKRWPQLTLSLSHSKKAGAAVVGLKSEYRSLGIDIELEARVVKKDILERISNAQDKNFRPIELWCLKEAVFKCCMNTRQFVLPIEFSDIVIDNKSWEYAPTGLAGAWEKYEAEGHILVIASLPL